MIRNIPFAFMSNSSRAGRDGSLVITNGQIIDLPGGSVKQYSSVRIDAGGILRITGNGGGWTEIDCIGSFIINGTILCRAGYEGQTTHTGGTFSKTSEIGLGNLSYSIVQANGGAGGKGANGTVSNGATGGAQSNGIGGGGGGGGVSTSNLATFQAGVGGTNGGNGASVNGNPGGIGNSSLLHGTRGENSQLFTETHLKGQGGGSGGGSGAVTTWSGGLFSRGAGGGGGGYRGRHGKGLAIKVQGNLSGTGSINCSGDIGGNGGAGGPALSNQGAGGGGGGGGAGGSGGKIVLRYKSGAVPNLLVSGGAAGVGGAVGTTGTGGAGGTNGVAGANGLIDVQQI